LGCPPISQISPMDWNKTAHRIVVSLPPAG